MQRRCTHFLSLLVTLLFTGFAARAQETTSTLTGTVTDDAGKGIEYATIVAVHVPTGTVSGAQTGAKGIYTLPNLRPGGPYTITITYVGYGEQKMENVNLTLGENPGFSFKMKGTDATALKEVNVVAVRGNSGGTNVGKAQLNTLPTLGRSLSDFTRLTPQSNNNSFAGSSFRYNNITMDGAVNNDAIGFSNSFGGQSGGGQSGTAGAGSRTNPYSLDAIQEVQVQLAPFDVKLGNFTGGSVNAVTKSGTNDFHGDVYAYGRNSALVGGSVDGQDKKLGSDFHDYQAGGSLGGAIIKNKLFFFVNGEITRRDEPTFYNAGDPGSAISIADAQKIKDHLISEYGYDPGSYGQAKISTNSNKLFARLDYNINKNNTLMIRGIYTNGSGQNLERTTTNFQFSSTDFTQHTNNINVVAELKSTIKPGLYNTLTASYINVHEYRDIPGQLSPFIDIGGGTDWLGTWREAAIYNTRQQTKEITDNLTWIKGINKFTFGTHNEFYNIDYNFINSWNGRVEYADLAHFLADEPSRIRGSYNLDPTANGRDALYNDAPGAKFNVNLLSAYAQDEITVTPRFRVTPGLRVDYSGLPKQPALDSTLTKTPDYINAVASSYTHTSYGELSNKWLGNAMISPRLGFNWDVNGNQNFVVRGGTGIFTGRMPFAWLGYAYTLSGGNYGTIDYKPGGTKVVPLAMDPTTLQDTITKYGGTAASSTREVDIVDKNFHLPTVWRSDIATDIKFGHGYKLTLDALYTKTVYDVKFQQINVRDTFIYLPSGPSQTPVYVGGKDNTAFSNVYLLSNTTEGYRYNLTAQLSKNFNSIGLGGQRKLSIYASAAYTYGQSKDVANGIRNSFQSNYELNPAVSPESPTLQYSNFDVRDRIVGVASFNLKWSEHHNTSLAFFYSGTSGSPYSFIYNPANNQFGNASNAAVVYVPKDQNDIHLADTKNADGTTYTAAQQWTDLNNVITNDKYLNSRRGEYANRNGARTPWNHELDMKIMHQWNFNVSKSRTNSIQLSLDMFNVLNLLNNGWGHQYFVTNVNDYTVNLLNAVPDASGVKPGAATYTPTYNFIKPTFNGKYYTVDPISSRWQMQFGIKYLF